jgi:hypothetical protein
MCGGRDRKVADDLFPKFDFAQARTARVGISFLQLSIEGLANLSQFFRQFFVSLPHNEENRALVSASGIRFRFRS